MALRRFYNANLRGIYEACPLPVLRPPNPSPAHVIPERLYERGEVQRCDTWTHTQFTPPNPWTRPPTASTQSLSTPFRDFDATRPTPTSNAKRAKTTSAVKKSQEDDDEKKSQEVEDDEKKRKTPPPPTNGQKRKNNLDGHFRTVKVLMLPTAEQRRELRRCFRVCRYAYNWANECVREGFSPPNHFRLRNKFRQLKIMESLPYANTTATAVASSIVSNTIKQLTDAYASNQAKRRTNPRHRYHIKFRSMTTRTPTETIILEKDPCRGNYADKCSTLHRFCPVPSVDSRSGRSECLAFLGSNFSNVGGIRLQDSNRIITKMVAEGNRLHENAKIHWDKRTGAFHFIYLYTIPRLPDPDPTFAAKRIVSMDPGCAPFQEWYSPTSGEFGQLLHDARPTLKAKCLALDALQGRIDRRVNQPRMGIITEWRAFTSDRHHQRRQHYHTTRRLRHKLARDRRRVHGWVEGAHYDAANFLLREHDVIVQPVLAVRRLTERTQRIFGSKTARAMYTWSHYLFRQRLKSAADRYAGRRVYETTEPGTSKTCTHCGFWKANLLLSDKIFDCPRCNIAVDRQLAGARNNFLAAYGLAIGVGWDGG
jgi:transposase